MITKVSKKPEITFRFTKLAEFPHVYYWLEVNINAKKRQFLSQCVRTDDCAWDTNTVQHLEDICERKETLRKAVEDIGRTKPRYLSEEETKNLPFEEWQQNRAAWKVWEKQSPTAMQSWKQAWVESDALAVEMARNEADPQLLRPAIRLESKDADERSYALYRGAVWCSNRNLQAEQWQILADRFLDREGAELAAALAGSKLGLSRERIAPEVKIAVWNRDNGKCAGCESQERLEYDHIIPVSRGGSNTARNISTSVRGLQPLKIQQD